MREVRERGTNSIDAAARHANVRMINVERKAEHESIAVINYVLCFKKQ